MIRRESIFFKIIWVNSASIIIICFLVTILCINISQNIIAEESISSVEKNIDYIKEDFINYNYQIVEASNKINKSNILKEYLIDSTDDSSRVFSLVMELSEYMESNKEYLSPKNSHIVAVGNNSKFYSTNSLNWDIELKDFFEKQGLKDNNNSIGYKSADTSEIKSVKYDNSILAVKPLRNLKDKSEVYGHLYTVIDERAIFKMYERYVTKGITFSLISYDGKVMSSNEVERINKEDLELLENIASNNAAKKEEKKIITKNRHTIISEYIPFFDAYFIADINHNKLSSNLGNLLYYMLFIALVIVAMIIFIIYIVSYKFSKPLIELVEIMSVGTLDPINNNDMVLNETYEIKLLTEAYNNMIKEIDYYVENLISEGKERRKAELNALQMQINPHFIYNTLGTIKYLARDEKIKEVDKTIDSLIYILQNTIGTTEELITIEQEIQNLDKYIYINKLRFGSGTNVDIQVDKECNSLSIPKLIIQPFLENAFFHGFVGMDNGNISIYINRKGNNILIEILDNGVGMKETNINDIDKKRSRGGIGIKNIHERLKIMYGSEYGVEVVSEKGYGTSITMKIPINE